jgi:hypothetical protein
VKAIGRGRLLSSGWDDEVVVAVGDWAEQGSSGFRTTTYPHLHVLMCCAQ